MRNIHCAAILCVLSASASAPALAADDATVRKDLTAVIALQGKPCGEVTSAQKIGENDYQVSCSDGARYHVYIDASNRVVVQPL